MTLHELRAWIANINNLALKKDRSKPTRLLANYIMQYPNQFYFVLETLERKPQLLLMRALLVSKFSIVITAVKQLITEDQDILVALYGLKGQKPITMERVGKKFFNSITNERVRQKEEIVIKKLSVVLTDHLISSPISDGQKRVKPLSGVGSSSVQTEKPGGIDMNPNNLNLQTQGGRFDFQLPLNSIDLQNIRIDGFTPVIINVAPLTNLPLLLGLVEETEETENVRITPGRDPMDHRMEYDEELVS